MTYSHQEYSLSVLADLSRGSAGRWELCQDPEGDPLHEDVITVFARCFECRETAPFPFVIALRCACDRQAERARRQARRAGGDPA